MNNIRNADAKETKIIPKPKVNPVCDESFSTIQVYKSIEHMKRSDVPEMVFNMTKMFRLLDGKLILHNWLKITQHKPALVVKATEFHPEGSAVPGDRIWVIVNATTSIPMSTADMITENDAE